MARSPAGSSLGPNLGADPRRVYGGRVIAESEEEYATRRQPALLSQGYVDPYRAAAGPQYASYRVAAGNGGGLSLAAREHHQQVFAGRQDGQGMVVYPGAELERTKSGGLLRSIRDGTMAAQGAGKGQLLQQANFLQQLRRENQYVHSGGVQNAVDSRMHHQHNSYVGQCVYPGHSLAIRDQRVLHSHAQAVGENICTSHEDLRREARKRKVIGNDMPMGGPPLYASPHHDVPRAPVQDLMSLQRHQMQTLVSSRNVQPLSFPSGQNPSILQGARRQRLSPPETVHLGHCSPQSINQPARPMALQVGRNSTKQVEGVGSFTALLQDVHEPAKVESIRCRQVARSEFPHEPVAMTRGSMEYKRQLLSHSPRSSQLDMIQMVKTPSMGSSHSRTGLQPVAYPPSLPQSIQPAIGQQLCMTGQASQGPAHLQPDVRQVHDKPSRLTSVSSDSITRRDLPMGTGKSRWSAETMMNMDRGKETVWCMPTATAELNALQVKSPLEGIMQQQAVSHGLLEAENEMGENDAMLRPFGDTVGTEDLFDEAFGLESGLPAGGSFASMNQTNPKDRVQAPEDPQSLSCSGHGTSHATVSNPCDAVQMQQLTKDVQVDQWREKIGGSSHKIQNSDILESGDDGESPGTSLDFMDISTAQIPAFDTDFIWEQQKQTCDQPEPFFLDRIHGKNDTGNEIFNHELFEEGDTTEDEELNLDTIKGNVGLKCPRVFHNLSSNEKVTRAPSPSRDHKKQTHKQRTLSIETVLPYQMCDFLAGAGLGFNEKERQIFHKTPPKLPKKMMVKEEDVVQLAISMAGKPTVTVKEILDICSWWQLQAEAGARAASRANVLKNWHGLKVAATFTEITKGRKLLMRCLDQDDRFVLCGFADDGQELWGCRQMERCADNLEERRSDSDEKTNYWTSEQEEWRLKCAESPSTTTKHDESAYQQAAMDERERRQKLTNLQIELGPKHGLGLERVLDNSEEHRSPFRNFVDDTQSLNHSSTHKRNGSSSIVGMKSDSKDCSMVQSPGKPKIRSLSDVYARGPKVINGNESSGAFPEQEMDSRPSSERAAIKHNGRIINLDREKSSRRTLGPVGDWLDSSNGFNLNVMAIARATKSGLKEKLSESETGDLLDVLPECDRPLLFSPSVLQAASSNHRKVLRKGKLNQDPSKRCDHRSASTL